MDLPPGLIHIVAQTRLFTDAQNYVILRVALSQAKEAEYLLTQRDESFSALVRDKDEATLVLPRAAWEQSRPMLKTLDESPDFRLITFDLPLDLGLVGYLATLSGQLAERGVSIFAISAFSRDHILVSADDFDLAWDTLSNFIHACQEKDANPGVSSEA